ncbi:MAG: pyruvate:ferredoxin (flavodoxin) oxidoreductase, partial [Clostridia bacterium]|nr:pyruvate:ferredoxin (flavodoxin) oxidoreductase [Clostridia bacterium]
DGFRTSHEIQKIYDIDEEDIKSIYPFDAVEKFRKKSLSPEHPIQKGTAQNPDVYFQSRERVNSFYDNVYAETLSTFKQIESITNRCYAPYEYYGHPNAEYIIVVMGSAFSTIKETIDDLNSRGEKYGAINVRLYRPFVSKAFCDAIPESVKSVAVLDRTKDSGAVGEPLYVDVLGALYENNKHLKVIGGRYGIGSKEFTPNCVKAVFDNLKAENSKNHFTVGIDDDITHTSLNLDDYTINDDCYELKFFGLGSDGTVSANKNSIKIIGESTQKYVQGYFEYDSKKSGSITISHLRISDKPILKTYNVTKSDFIAIHNFSFVSRYDLLAGLKLNGTVLINTVLTPCELEKFLPQTFIDTLKQNNAKLYTINAQKIANQVGLGNKINIIMQTAFFKLSNQVPYENAKQLMKQAIEKTYGKKGEKIVSSNISAIDLAENAIINVDYSNFSSTYISDNKPSGNKFFDEVINPVEKRKGDKLPVSAMSADGSIPTDTAKYLKRGIAQNIPIWLSDNCIQCGFCTLACPHAAIRSILVEENNLNNLPDGFSSKKAIGVPNCRFRIQISPEDCTGCGVCVKTCPALKKALEMRPMQQVLDNEQKHYNYGETLPRAQSPFPATSAKGLQFKKPYFEFNFACAGCGETPYIKIATQLFGDKMIIANATGCSSIYGGYYPACPYAKDKNGRGPSWANSLFEDNAEFGLGISMAEKIKYDNLFALVEKYNTDNAELSSILENWKQNRNCTYEEKEKICELLSKENTDQAKQILSASENFVKKSVWIIGGDGWAYDIGYGGLDHILSSNENVNILVLDSEVYSNTG